MKLANELAKARQQELPIEKAIQDVRRDSPAVSAPLGSGLADEARTHIMNRGQRLQQEETRSMGYNSGSGNVHPKDTVPAMLTPGEAVIPAPAAQDPANKPVIRALVNQGRAMNAAENRSAPLGTGFVNSARREREALGYNQGTTATPFFEVGSDVVEQMITEEELARLSKIPVSELTAEDARKIAQVSGRVDRLSENDITYIPFGTAPKAEKMFAREMEGAKADFSLATNIKELEKEIGRTRDPKAKEILQEELTRLKGQNPAVPMAATKEPPVSGWDEGGGYLPDWKLKQMGVPGASGTGTTNAPVPKRLSLDEERKSVISEELSSRRSRMGDLKDGYGSSGTDQKVPVPTAISGEVPPVSAPVEVPKPSQPVPTKSTAEIVAGAPAVDLGKDPGAQHVAMLDNLLKDPVVTQKLSILEQQKPPEGTPLEEQKNILAQGLSKIFGDSGMFNSEDLIRFALLAAGGMLTGGSVGGSIRYAGLHTLQASDQRRAGEKMARQKEMDARRAAAQAAFVDRRELLQQREGQFMPLIKDISPAGYQEAMEYYNQYLDESKSFPERQHALRQAMHVASRNQVDKSSKEPKITAGKHFKTGEDMDVMQVGEVRMVSPAGANKYIPESETNRALDPSAFRSRKQDQEKAMEDRINAALLDMNRKDGRNGGVYDKDFNATVSSAKAKGLAQEMIGILEDLGHDADPKALATAAEITLQNLHEEFKGDPRGVSSEAMRKTMFGTAVVAMRPSNAALYKPEIPVSDKAKNILGAEAYTVITEKVKEGVKLTGGKLRPDQIMEDIEKTYKETLAENPKLEKDLKAVARSRPGQSAFSVWLTKYYKPQ